MLNSGDQSQESLIRLFRRKLFGKAIFAAEPELQLEVLRRVGVVELELNLVLLQEDYFCVERVSRVLVEDLVVLCVQNLEFEGLRCRLQVGHLDFELVDGVLFVFEDKDLALEGFDLIGLEAAENGVFEEVLHVAVRGYVHEQDILLEFVLHFFELLRVSFRPEGLYD